MKTLGPDFFNRKTLKVTQELLGKYLVRDFGNGEKKAYKITEVEAYVGVHDLASHASKGRTKRTEILYSHPGTIYVYFVYGVHWMLNVVTEPKEYPSAILIRGVEGIVGPGRVTKQLRITGALNGTIAGKKSGLWFEDRGEIIKAKDIERTPRIGVNYAGEIWAAKPYRFVLKKKT